MKEAPFDRDDVGRRLHEGLEASDTVLPPGDEERLTRLMGLLHKWNRTYNLTAVRDPAESVSVHLLDSLSISPFLFGNNILDVGTGPGFPGLPLAITMPGRVFHLLDSNGKKVAFVRQCVAELRLTNVVPVEARCEGWAPSVRFDTIVSRAFSSLRDFVGVSRHLLAPGGRWVAMKGVRPDAEVAELPSWCRVQRIEKLNVPGLRAERHVVMLETQGAPA